MQFLVTAMDYKDDQAIDRRIEHRPAHLDGVKKMIAAGSFLSGGAILDGSGKMIGSTLHLEFENREALHRQLDNDPYVAGKVWENIEVQEAKLVPMR
jgi:uncharacterized protein